MSDQSTHNERMKPASVITRDPRICGGQPVIRGTRVLLRTLPASIANGDSEEEILKDFPTVSAEDLRAVVAYAAASALDDQPIGPVPAFP